DPNWLPLGAPGGDGTDFTPPFPAYTSGHATFGGVTFQMLRNFYGTDEVEFVLASDELPGVTRTYSNFTQAELENGLSRVYLGVHWRFDSTEGTAIGNQIADQIFKSFLRPKHDGDIDKDGKIGPEDLLLLQRAWYGKDGD
ncbi:MAG: vanadium-dependent haloperoxidase, partial [Candidatus Omnitrophica bacterium]|nr:vanadium-dependent haloperoxidase [Candidatus Omnitrophota bacterium]